MHMAFEYEHTCMNSKRQSNIVPLLLQPSPLKNQQVYITFIHLVADIRPAVANNWLMKKPVTRMTSLRQLEGHAAAITYRSNTEVSGEALGSIRMLGKKQRNKGRRHNSRLCDAEDTEVSNEAEELHEKQAMIKHCATTT